MSLPFDAPGLADQIAHVEERPARNARYGEIRMPMHSALQERLKQAGVERLYRHQAEAYDAAMQGRDTVVVTGTNSGKSMAYHLPALQMAMVEPAARVMYLFPTKALAQDQLGKLEQLAPTGIRCGVYDGDTPQSQRSSIRKLAHILLTNPDMLHVGIVPGHENWVKFLKSLRLIAIDEMHVYRGVFGANVGNVLRRLLRLCEWYHNRPQIVACSATIGNPEELFYNLTGRKPELIDQDGSPSGKRTFVFWNPPLLDDAKRASANFTSSQILAELVKHDVRTLAFSRARLSAELVLRHTRSRLESDGKDVAEVESYRGGYTAKERRQIEQDLFKGKLKGLSATNALELGVDVGSLDAVVMNGYPGTASSFWQQAGRAGRGTRDGMAIYVAHDDPLEQFFIRQPKLLMGSINERVSANQQNPHILSKHLLCAAHERPMSPSELPRFGEKALELAESLDRSGELAYRHGLFYYPGFDPPAMRVNIRSAGGDTVRLLVGGEELGTMEFSRALTQAHVGAVYLHRGRTFILRELDLAQKLATLEPTEANYYTQAIVQATIESKAAIAAHDRVGVGLHGISVTEAVLGFRKKSLDGDTVLDTEDLDLPPQTYETVGVRFDLPETDLDQDMERQIGGVHGVEHALLAVAPVLAGCDRNDLGSAWYSLFPDTMRPATFIFDKAPGGIGLSESLFGQAEVWANAALELLNSCPCDAGCPACLYSSRCEVGNEALDKVATVSNLRWLANRDG